MENYPIHAIDRQIRDAHVKTTYYLEKRDEVGYDNLQELGRAMIKASEGRLVQTFSPSPDISGRIDIGRKGEYVDVWRHLTDTELGQLASIIVSEAEGHRLREASKVASP